MEDLLTQFPVVIECPVVWGEMDSFQHVNNVVYFRYFETARMAYFERMNFTEYLGRTGIGPILHSANCRFRIPLTYPDTVSIGTRSVDLKADRYTMEFQVFSHRHQKVAAEGDGIIVTFDYRAGTKTAIPDEMRNLIERIEARTS
jgi:acyl-CoA thioester hydrolase